MTTENKFSISAKTCALKYNSQVNGGIIFDNDIKYIIPIYQRPYSWTDQQIRKFLSDLFSSYWGTDGIVIEEPMFIGTMQLSDKNSQKEQDIIDGQQRLTTFLILIKVLKHKFPGSEELNNISLNWLSTRVNNGKQQSYLEELVNGDLIFNGETLNPYLKNAFLINEVIDEETKDEDGKQINFEIERFIKHILSNVYFVVIETRAGLSKTLQIFNAINTTGLDLNGGDIFKIRMYEYLRDKKGKDEKAFDDISRLYQKIDDNNANLGENETDIRGILNIYQFILIAKYSLPVTLYSYGSDAFFERLFDTMFNINQWEHFRNNVNHVELSIEDIEKIIDVRYEWENSHYSTGEDACVYYLFRWYSRYGRYWNLIFIFLFRFKDEDDYFNKMLLFKKQLNKIYLVYSIRYQKAINDIHSFTYALIKDLMNKSFEEVMETINKKINHINQHKHWLVEEVLNNGITYNAKIKNIICRLSAMIDEDFKSNDKSKIEAIRKALFDTAIDIEHIQSYHDINGDKREEIWNEWQENINSIGNLMILEQSINRSISNNEYEIKLQSYPASRFTIVKEQARNYPNWDLSICKARKQKEIDKILNYIFN